MYNCRCENSPEKFPNVVTNHWFYQLNFNFLTLQKFFLIFCFTRQEKFLKSNINNSIVLIRVYAARIKNIKQTLCVLEVSVYAMFKNHSKSDAERQPNKNLCNKQVEISVKSDFSFNNYLPRCYSFPFWTSFEQFKLFH